MKMVCVITFSGILFLFAIFAMADEEGEKDSLPPGMEQIKLGGSEYVVPIGARVSKRGDLIVVESANEYVARKIYEMQERLAEMEAREEEFSKQIEQINKTLTEIIQRQVQDKKD